MRLFGSLLMATALFAVPAHAQFGPIFDDRPPRPPADIPSAPPADRQLPPYYPSDRAPPAPDEPPPERLPAPMNLPPPSRPGAAAIQSQPLAPPPGIAPKRDATTPAPAPPRQPAQRDSPPANAELQPGDEVVIAPPPQRISNATAVFSGLDKITGRIISFDVAINETVQFGALQVTPRVCYSRPPTETPQTDAFVEVDEVTLQGEIKRIFTGWMFAASPGLHAVEHPIYDIWLTDCKGGSAPTVAEAPPEAAKSPPPKQPAPRQPPARRAPPLQGAASPAR
ncbi:MAG: DUF2155 domain-containing protein [Pseudolabrys sp.]|nr:DUF2155 domain-containing protein [Pseudolabrys sp.]